MADRRTLFAGAAAAIGALLVLLWPATLGHPWIAAMFFWSGVPVGSLGFLLMMRLMGGSWRTILAPAMADGVRGLLVPAIGTIPLLAAMGRIYPWVHHAEAGFRGAWLAPVPFIVRSLVWWLGLGGLIFAIGRHPGSKALAVVGLVFITLLGSLIAVDWMMSLDPDFHSSGFGLQSLSIQFTVALAVAIWRAPVDKEGMVGALLVTLIMLWGYFDYLPLLIIWSGDAPAGAAWYLARGVGGWKGVGLIAATIHAIVFAALLSPTVRHSTTPMRIIAIAVLAGNALQVAWMVLPADGVVEPLGVLVFLVALLLLGTATLMCGRSRA